ncbi:MAG: hypothetical protein ACOX15_03560 [Tepidanaerobacteraceae bacterium]|jgi:hypothetical protein
MNSEIILFVLAYGSFVFLDRAGDTNEISKVCAKVRTEQEFERSSLLLESARHKQKAV